MIRNSKYPGFTERRRLVQAFMERMPNPSLSCELKLSVSVTGSSRYRAKASEHDPVPRVRMISEFRWYHGLVIVRPKLMSIGLGLFCVRKQNAEVLL